MYKNNLHELRVNALKKPTKKSLNIILKTVMVYATGIYSELFGTHFIFKQKKSNPEP